jgi:hypothetical protein
VSFKGNINLGKLKILFAVPAQGIKPIIAFYINI